MSPKPLPTAINPLKQVLSTCSKVCESANDVSIVSEALDALAESLIKCPGDLASLRQGVEWDACNWHYSADAKIFGPNTCQYIFVLDALNFCFWPTSGLEYEHLALALKFQMEKDTRSLSAECLSVITAEELQSWFGNICRYRLPQAEERALRLREIGAVLIEHFDGLAANVVAAADGSACRLVSLVLQYFPGFRDTAVYKGQLCHFYKRAQILVGDLWAAYGRRKVSASDLSSLEGLYRYDFQDIDQLTMFADYRIPQILREVGVLRYSSELTNAIDSLEEIPFGCPWECEIRACTVVAVDMLQKKLRERGFDLYVVELDWLLWQKGEETKDSMKPHHRTLTIYY